MKAMKTIKFDLKLNNGETLRILDDLKNNLTPEVFLHFQSGKLVKWLRVRKLEEQANAVEKLLTEIHDTEVQSFKGFIELFGGEADVDSLRIGIAERKRALPSSVENSDEEVKQLKTEIEALKAEIEQLKNPPKPKGTIVENFIIHDDGTVTDTKTGLMWQQQEEAETFTWDDAMQYAKTSNFAGYSYWRLPTIDELKSLLDEKYKPTINPLAFPNTSEDLFWSSSPYADSDAWSVNFYSGDSYDDGKSSNNVVRLVR